MCSSDLGGSENVPVIAVLVKPGEIVQKEDPLFTLESEKATMDVPAPFAGTLEALLVQVGTKVSTGTLVARMRVEESQASAPPPVAASPTEDAPSQLPPAAAEPPASSLPSGDDEEPADLHLPLVVLGAGPGGYTAAFRAADLGLEVGLVER